MHSKIPMNIIIIPKNGVRISESRINRVRITEGLLYYYFDTGEYHKSVGLVRVPEAV